MNIWGRLGISVILGATFALTVTKLLRHNAFYEKNHWLLCGALGVTALCLLVVGHFANPQLRISRMTEDGELPPAPFFLVNMEYWGLMLGVFAVIVVFITPLKNVGARATAPAAPTKVENTNAPGIATNAAVNFPRLRLQGVVLQEPQPSALINGRTYFVGDLVQGAKVSSVGPTSVVVQLQGQSKTLLLDR